MSFEGLGFVASLVTIAALAFVLYVGLRGRRQPADHAIGEGRYEDALASADLSEETDRASLYAAAVAAKHLLDWSQATELLNRILDDDNDGEARLELGLVELYQGNTARALDCFDLAQSERADLLESLTLHRAFAHLRAGDERRARKLFEEVEAPLETKLRTDIGPGEPFFLEWFLQCEALWRAQGRTATADWARAHALQAVGESRLPELYSD